MKNLETNKIYQGDCLEVIKTFPEGSIDLICTDPPYGIGFMGKEWDTFKPDFVEKGVKNSSRKKTFLNPERSADARAGASPAMEAARYDHSNQGARRFREWFTEISVEMLRVLKPGAFAFVCIGARQDSVSAAITAMTEGGFKTDFTSLFWTYASGFPKASNISKMVDKRNGAERERFKNDRKIGFSNIGPAGYKQERYSDEAISDEAISDEAKTLQGSYGGFQPKPAVEVIIVAMKPLSEKTYVDQALKNGKGITWLDDVKIPGEDRVNQPMASPEKSYGGFSATATATATDNRFPANLLVSDGVLGDYSKFFSLNEWAKTLPFLNVPKPAKTEKNKGLDGREDETVSDGRAIAIDNAFQRGKTERKNIHPTVKPMMLMAYLIKLGSRSGDIVLDPFAGSCTTCVAAKELNRKFIGIEREGDYVKICNARIGAVAEKLF